MAVTQLPPAGRPPADDRTRGVPRRGALRASAGCPPSRPSPTAAPGRGPGGPPSRPRTRTLPMVPVRARGMVVEGADGRRYLDCLSGAGTPALGHNHPVVLQAIREVHDSGTPLQGLDLATPVQDAFAGELRATLPPALADHGRIWFCGPAGTDAVEAALTLVRTATGRDGLLTFPGAHPGTRTEAPWAPGGENDPGNGVRRSAGMLLEPPRSGRGNFPGVSPGRSPGGVAGGGVIPVPDGGRHRTREITAARGIPLIAAELHTGAGRTGSFWAIGHSGAVPDVMALSETIGGGLPLAAVVYHEDLEVRQPDAHAGAFRGNRLAMAAGAATFAHIRENGLVERAATLGERMLRRLRELAERPCIGEVRGRGLMLGLELVEPGTDAPEPGAPRPSAPALAAAVQRECLHRGLIVGLGGRDAAVVRLLPPLTVSDEQAEAVLDRLADAVEAAERGAGTASGPHRPGLPPRRPGR
ncbi:2,4-diaminobutyrate 4-aminotransferase [Streptomyces albus subsp. albus]|nr:2,4-diaminobutyrate 4-aminotransferase [Streptomyces albus subsp. albus]